MMFGANTADIDAGASKTLNTAHLRKKTPPIGWQDLTLMCVKCNDPKIDVTFVNSRY